MNLVKIVGAISFSRLVINTCNTYYFFTLDIDDIVEKRLVAALKSLGLTTFSSKIAIGFIQVFM